MKPLENFLEACHHDPSAHLYSCGVVSAEQVILHLVNQNRELVEKLMEAENLKPRRLRLPDGRVMLYQVPAHLIPITDLSFMAGVNLSEPDPV